jgi:eukaryotic translation initiation factor 2C
MAPIFVPVFYASHHGIVITPDNLPARVNHQIFKTLQFDVAPEIFTPQAVYDGRKNVFSSRKLDLGAEDMQEVCFSIAMARVESGI